MDKAGDAALPAARPAATIGAMHPTRPTPDILDDHFRELRRTSQALIEEARELQARVEVLVRKSRELRARMRAGDVAGDTERRDD
jgi:hypothetical protein